MKKNITSSQLLENFDINYLDYSEYLYFKFLLPSKDKVSALQELIDRSAGDYSILSDHLSSIAYLQECEM